MAIDLNLPYDEGGRALPDLNEALADEEEDQRNLFQDQNADQQEQMHAVESEVQGGANHAVHQFGLNVDGYQDQQEIPQDEGDLFNYGHEDMEEVLHDYGVYSNAVAVEFGHEELAA
ncbi:hypothetical protein E2562_030494 [Oryza meyeriana var. granulata]|uniref:Uncharacterized protein n=1 Tax=Oryza meyeriana var. granulata TaxID=110450 RepID=A0A6G1CTL7_9ORYZ|nr:hypothetical protein E2562_030494 [Oryza meyeriana var. granulata]